MRLLTKDGQLAGAGGDQSYTSGWESGNPFENLPLHMATLMAPGLMQIGAYESGRRVCMEIAMGYGRQFASDTIFTYPGNGRTGVGTSQTVHGEWPAIYVFSVGPWQFAGPLHLTNAKLRGPHGPVTVRVVDTAQHPKIKPYVSPGAYFLIPISALAPHTRYTATVTVAGDNDSQTKTWSFTTA